MRVEDLAPLIRQILTAPDTDLTTVSAKRVRKRLVELHPEVTTEYIKENKDKLDELIGDIFQSISPPEEENAAAAVQEEAPEDSVRNGNGKRKWEDVKSEDQGYTSGFKNESDESLEPAPSVKRVKKQNGQLLADEEYARQLASELNQRPSRGSRNPSGVSKKAGSRSTKKKKSKAEVEDSDEENNDDGDSDGDKKPRKKTKKGSGEAKGGFAKEMALSEPLAAVLGVTHLSRPQVVKRLWEYIKGNELQNPNNKKEILCDASLKAVFNSEKIDMFGMNKVLSQHLYEPES